MMKRNLLLLTLLLVMVLGVGACSAVTSAQTVSQAAQNATPVTSPTSAATLPATTPGTAATAASTTAPAAATATLAPANSAAPAPASVRDWQSALEQIYANVNPSVVLVEVVGGTSPSANPNNPNSPFGLPPNHPNVPRSGLGSGFMWDANGNIVTNNHVVDGASQISVTFADGTVVTGKVVGTDPNSDLAVIKVSAPASEIHPVTLADSTQLKVGQLAIAIGNPFGEQNTMTTGIISALGRALPVGDGTVTGPTYQIPDVIQTDAPINPGNSGGVLLNDQGQVVGVTAAIESASQSNSGIGFAIPAAIVQKVVPALIQNGHYDHPYLGISGGDLTPELAQAMNLSAGQRGALVNQVTPGGPADKAGLKGSTQATTIQGQSVNVGGDVVTALAGHPVKTFDDLVADLEQYGQIGQPLTLTILRGGQSETITVTPAARPATAPAPVTTPRATAGASLGVRGLTVSSEIAQAMNLPATTQGVLVEQVVMGSPAERAGLQGSTKTVTINGTSVQVGGDIITAVNNINVTSINQLQRIIQASQSGQTLTLAILRNGQQQTIQVTLGTATSPTQTP